jgi:hypothetical protein
MTDPVPEDELPISELFGRDPLDLTRTDIDRIVEKYRGSRELFAAGIKPARATKAKKADIALDLLDAAGETPDVDLDLLS